MGGRITNSEAQLQPDPRYQDKLVAKFVNCIMYDGKKATAQKVVYQAFDTIQARLEKEKLDTLPRTAIEVFQKAIEKHWSRTSSRRPGFGAGSLGRS